MASCFTFYIYLLVVVGAPCYCEETPDLGDKTIIASFKLYMMTITPTTAPDVTRQMADRGANGTTTVLPSENTSGSSSETTPPDATSTFSSQTPPDATSTFSSQTTPPDATSTFSSQTTPPDATSTFSSQTTPPDATSTFSSQTTPPYTMTDSSSEATSTDSDVSRIPNTTVTEVINWLTGIFQNETTGFETLEPISDTSLSINSQTEYLPITYQVTFNVSILSEESALCSDDERDECLSKQLMNTMEEIVAHNESFVGGFYVDQNKTQGAMEEAIVKFTEDKIENICTTMGDVCSNINNTCYVNDSKIICENNCDLYLRDTNPQCREPNSSLDIIFVKGECVMNYGFPECNCGSSPGDLMANFYDGTRCISSAFVVGIAAGVGGFIIVVLLGLAIGFGCKSNDKGSHKDVIKAYSDSPFDSPKQDLIMETEVGKSPITNPAYDSRYETFTKTEEDFPNFQPNLLHIDPAADYSVPRPNISEDHSYTFLYSTDRL